jgi:hypothetical protein
MNSIFDPRRRWLVAALGLACVQPRLLGAEQSGGPIRSVERFDAQTWARLLRSGARPAAYVFTTTYCPTCPEVFEVLHASISARRQRVELVAVVMDAQGARALMHARHYTGATRLFAFDGFEPEIRQAVDPKWRNITPYVVLIDRQGADQRIIGPPDAKQLKAWLT